jgi:hypothetical protein
MASSKKRLKQAEKAWGRFKENQYKSRGGRATFAFKDKSRYSRKSKHQQDWA